MLMLLLPPPMLLLLRVRHKNAIKIFTTHFACNPHIRATAHTLRCRYGLICWVYIDLDARSGHTSHLASLLMPTVAAVQQLLLPESDGCCCCYCCCCFCNCCRQVIFMPKQLTPLPWPRPRPLGKLLPPAVCVISNAKHVLLTPGFLFLFLLSFACIWQLHCAA